MNKSIMFFLFLLYGISSHGLTLLCQIPSQAAASCELDRMHGLDWYDSEARYLDVLYGARFTGMDPLAEESPEVSPYAYCRNNFVNRIDPDGKDILIWYKDKKGKNKLFKFNGFSGQKTIKIPNNSFILDFIRAYTYNKNNGGGKSTIEVALNPDIQVYLSESNQDRNHYQPGRQPTVFWNSRKALLTTDGGKQSPATALEHEMDHALGDLLISEHNKYRDRRGCYDEQYDNAEERKVIQGRESETAKANNESIRKDHKGKLYLTDSPISTIKIK